MNILRRFSAVARTVLTRRFVYGYIYSFICDFFSVKEKFVLLESHHGSDFFGSPYYLALNIVSDARYDSLQLIVVASRRRKAWVLGRLGAGRVKVVRPRGLAYVYYLAVSKWLISDVTFPLYFSRREEQCYLNTWHGTPLKSLGRDTPFEAFSYVGNTQRNFLHASFILVPNRFTENVLLDAYMIRNLGDRKLVRRGYPRNDVLVNSKAKSLSASRFDVAFMPTWRGDFSTRKAESLRLLEALKVFLDFLDDHLPVNFTIWVRLHPQVSGKLSFGGYDRVKSFPVEREPYEHLSCCHALVTDYSSVMFDFACTGRPIFLYVPDLDSYRSGRNMYMALEALPFFKTTNHHELLGALVESQSFVQGLAPTYAGFLEKFCPWDEGVSSKEVCDQFFGGLEAECALSVAHPLGKTRVLFYVGALLNNGIARSFQTLLPLLDDDRYEITVLADSSHDREAAEEYFLSLGRHIKYIPLVLSVYVSPLNLIGVASLYFFRADWFGGSGVLRKIWSKECSRIFGNSQFDVFVNFNGYSWRAALLSLGLDCKKVVYVHNEMVKEVAANRVFDSRLLRLSYEVADSVAIVREGVESEYCEKVYDYRNKAVYTPNPLLIDVSARAAEPLANAFYRGVEAEEYQRVERCFRDGQKFSFVNLGRFSPEKGQLRLIEAFEQVWQEHPDTQLFIVGSHGVLLDEIRARQKRSPARESIFIVVGSNNPFPLVKRADAFVFSSFYEGIGLVLFEAMQLRMPVISTDIPGPSELLSEGYGLLVENSVGGLVYGMLEALQGRVSTKAYDFYAHNEFAVSQFDKCIDQALGR
ncbi:glycosyltransferase [Halopseudomonas sp.]|uniref:glycosyltransferase n=1 Tax=Halopseudomonas sp. TaxID=2901191 RepID=UPI00311D8979